MTEQEVIDLLQLLEDEIPSDLWIFCNGTWLYLMKKKNGQRVMSDDGEGYNSNYVRGCFAIDNDGGDW